MNKNHKKLHNHLKDSYESVKMDTTKSVSIREHLSAYADLHQMPASVGAGNSSVHFFTMSSLFPRAIGMALLAFFVVGTGVTYASQEALPGDVLYRIKVTVAEPIEALVYQKPQERALWKNVLVARRLDEASALEQSGKLDEKREAEVALQVALALDSSEEAIALVEAEGAIEAADTLRVSLTGKLKSFTGEETSDAKISAPEESKEKHSSALRALVLDRTLALEAKERTHENADKKDETNDTHEYVREQGNAEGDVHATTLIDTENATTTEDGGGATDNSSEGDSQEGSSTINVPLPQTPSLGL